MKECKRPRSALPCRLPVAKQPGGKKQQRSDECKQRFARDSDQSQWKRDNPKNWQENQRQQRQRPTQQQQNAPSNKQNQNFHWLMLPVSSQVCPSFGHGGGPLLRFRRAPFVSSWPENSSTQCV